MYEDKQFGVKSTSIRDNRELWSTLFSTTHLHHDESKSASSAISNSRITIWYFHFYMWLTLKLLCLHLLHHILYILSQCNPKPTENQEVAGNWWHHMLCDSTVYISLQRAKSSNLKDSTFYVAEKKNKKYDKKR